MDQRIIQLYDEYTHRPLRREDFLKKLTVLAGGTAAASVLLPMLEGNYALGQTLPDEEGIVTSTIEYSTEDGIMKGYLCRPDQPSKFPAVIIIHENRGLNAHIEDVARRAAKAGFLALAPDALSLLGGTPSNEDEARGLFAKLDNATNIMHFSKAIPFLKDHFNSNGKVGCVGFCWGGAMANQLAVHNSDLMAAVAFYGKQPESADVPAIKAAIQLHYAGLDERINAGIPAYETALISNKIEYEIFKYPDVNHAFHNDTSVARYNAAAAQLAWQRTIDFLKKRLAK